MLILRKIIKIVATRCQILRLKFIKFDFDPTVELTALPQTLQLDLRGPTPKGRKWKGRGEGGQGRVKGKRKGW